VIEELTPENFVSRTKNQPRNVASFVMFGAEWCGHCRNFKADMFQNFANAVSQVPDHPYNVKFYSHTQSDSNQIFDRFRISSFPSLIIIHNNKYYKFNDRRNIEALVDFTINFEKLESKDYPEQPTIIDKTFGIFEQLVDEVKREYSRNPRNTLIFGGLFALLLILTPIITCVVTDKFMEKKYQKEMQQRVEVLR
jgi:thiol-disulfide isomerase/thioredoxin